MSKKILIVEDDLRLKITYDTIFSQAGFTVLRAQDGEEGLRIARAEQPDIILLDMTMPKMDGLEFLRNFDVKNSHPETKIIVFSNMMQAETTKQAYELGATRYEVKATFSPKELAQLVNETLAAKPDSTPTA
jgi:DNA-binding response OmpR family regulator